MRVDGQKPDTRRERRTSGQLTAKSTSIKDAERRSGDCARKAVELTPGELSCVTSVTEGVERGAADKAANLARWKSLCRQLPVFGRLAYPERAEATKHGMPGCKSLGCPAAVQQRWERSGRRANLEA